MGRCRIVVAGVAIAIVSAACGGSATTPQVSAGGQGSAPSSTVGGSGDTSPSIPPGDTAPARPSILPDVRVNDVAAGTTINLNSLTPAAKPLLVWFWAPH